MKRYKAIIFDFDMTLADTARIIVDLLNDTARHFGYPAMEFSKALPTVGNTHEIMLSHVTGEKDPEKLLEMRTYYRALCRSEMPVRTEFFPDAPACLRTIAKKGVAVGLLSQKLRDVLMASLVKYELADCFQVVFGCEEVPAAKPDPAGLIAMMQALGVTAEETLYVGDSLVDEGAARGAGTDFAAMLRGGTAREQFDPAVVTYFYQTAEELRLDVLSMPARVRD